MQRMSKGFTLMELMVVIAIISILSALAVPSFLQLEARAKQAEVKTNLRALYVAEKAYYQEQSSYSPQVATIGFAIERSNRYQYNLNGTGSVSADNRTGTALSTAGTADAIMIDVFRFPSAYTEAALSAFKCGQNPAVVTGTLGSFIGGAQGNIDGDTTTDQWTISSGSRTTVACDAATNVPAGEPANDQNDVNQ